MTIIFSGVIGRLPVGGHAWIATTMGYVHVHRAHVDDSWTRAAKRSATRLERAKR